MRIVEIEGIGPVYAAKLRNAGIDTTDELLAAGATPRGRAGLVERTGISHKLILEWVNHADLMRIDGVGSEYSDLLEEAGVDSPPELSHRVAANLERKIVETVATHPDIVRRTPSEHVLQGWIDQAKKLPAVVQH